MRRLESALPRLRPGASSRLRRRALETSRERLLDAVLELVGIVFRGQLEVAAALRVISELEVTRREGLLGETRLVEGRVDTGEVTPAEDLARIFPQRFPEERKVSLMLHVLVALVAFVLEHQVTEAEPPTSRRAISLYAGPDVLVDDAPE